MKFIFEKDKLIELMHDFYTLTKIRIVIFDVDFCKVASFPENEGEFCNKIKTNLYGNTLCKTCDKEACKLCAEKNSLHIYRCHAGLIEAVSPLKLNDITIGYIMFGQIIEKNDKKANKNEIINYITKYTEDYTEAETLFSTLVSKSEKQICAAAKIMETCACYLCVSKLVKIDNGELIFHLDNYINNNIKENLTAQKLCAHFNISKNKLYMISNKLYGMGIADYIRKKRVYLAKSYLEKGYSVSESAEMSGFNDYNYFSKIFKKEIGVLPSKIKC